MNIKISKNFSLNELTKSSTATRLGIDNTPTANHLVPMTALCHKVLQPIRETWGVVSVNSCYRSPALNEAVKGSKSSQHCKGEAADVECIGGIDNDLLATWIVKNLEFDQLILEYFDPEKNDPNDGWVHVSYSHDGNNRGKALLINSKSKGYQPWEPTKDHIKRLKEIS
tara:strand:+ start:1799 stop:2305 length:507 start_codon:yes stop_codon:yes gene_type:complete